MSIENIMRVKRMSKWNNWWDSLTPTTRKYFEDRMAEETPIIIISIVLGMALGFVAGLLVSL